MKKFILEKIHEKNNEDFSGAGNGNVYNSLFKL